MGFVNGKALMVNKYLVNDEQWTTMDHAIDISYYLYTPEI